MKKMLLYTIFFCLITPGLMFGNTREKYSKVALTIITNISYYPNISYSLPVIPHYRYCTEASEGGTFSYHEKVDIYCSTPPTPDHYLMRIQLLSSYYPYGKVFCDFSYNYLNHHINWITHHPYQGKKPYPPVQCKISSFSNHIFLFVYDKKP